MVDFIKVEDHENDSNVFTFPYNPQSLDITGSPHADLVPQPFTNYNVSVSNGTFQPRRCTIQGHFSGVDKNTQYDEIDVLFHIPTLKRFYFRPDRFLFMIEGNTTPTFNANRSNFTGYSIFFDSAYNAIQGATLKTSNVDNNNNWTNGSEKNNGTYKNTIEQINITLNGNTGSLIIDKVKLFGIGLNIPSHTAGNVLTINFMEMVESNGLSINKAWISTLNGVRIGRSIPSGKAFLGLELNAGESIDSIRIIGSVFSNIEFKFRDGFTTL